MDYDFDSGLRACLSSLKLSQVLNSSDFCFCKGLR